MFKCQVLSALSFMFRHYCFMFGPPLAGAPTRARARAPRQHVHARTRGAHVFHVGARTERLKLIRVYDRRIKCRCRVSREDRQLMCAVPRFTLHHHRISQSLFQYSCLAKSRRSHGALSCRGDCCAGTTRNFEAKMRNCVIHESIYN